MRRTIVRQTTTAAIIVALGLALLVALLSGVAPFGSEAKGQDGDSAPSVVVWPGVGELHSGSSFAIMGTGFQPGQKIHVLVQTSVGRGFAGTVTNEITENVHPPIEAVDESGNFAARFDMGRFERVMSEGIAGITVTDADFNVLASTPVAMCDPQGRSRVLVYPRGAPDYAANPDDPRPSTYCAGFFEYPERPEAAG
ncbi:MAG: hypothetical protein F4045_11915 [Chloroflexi bacterium]|nr:hypothetical protein [Chloroflexota bacterium]MYK35773.1 hypothetical protein [Chloroflexota bacterium]